MKRLSVIMGIIVVLLLAGIGAVSAAPFSNGDFESPDITSATHWDIFSLSAFPSLIWNVEWVGDSSPFNGFDIPATPFLELQETGADDGIAPHGGNQYAELDTDWNGHDIPNIADEPANVRISQNIDTITGAKYRISYWQRCRLSESTCNLQFDWGAFSTSTAGVPSAWTEHVVDLTATGALTTISFTDTGDPDTIGTLIDDVTVTQISEPPTIPEFPTMALPAALIVGMLGAVLFIKSTKEN